MHDNFTHDLVRENFKRLVDLEHHDKFIAPPHAFRHPELDGLIRLGFIKHMTTEHWPAYVEQCHEASRADLLRELLTVEQALEGVELPDVNCI